MRFEIPDFKRCCLCIPLRHGVLIFGYLNMIFTLFFMGVEAWIDFGDPITSYTVTMYRGVGMYTQMWLPYILYSLEIIFNVVLLIGAHTKKTRLLRLFYYYGIMTTVAAALCFVVVRFQKEYFDFFMDYLDFCLAFIGLVFQGYLLLLVRAELMKLKYQQGQFSYVNHMSEVVLEPPIFGDGRNPL